MGGKLTGGEYRSGRERLQAHVAALDGPLVVLLQQPGADEAHDGRLVGEYTHHVGVALDLAVEPLERVVAVDLRPVLGVAAVNRVFLIPRLSD